MPVGKARRLVSVTMARARGQMNFRWRPVILIPRISRLSAAEPDFVAAIASSRPLAFYRLNAASGKSEIGPTTYNANGGVSTGPGIFGGATQSAKLDGHDGYIVTTQS
jgi:hypothetical protein